MDVISELNSDIALAILVEKRHWQKLKLREAIEIMFRVNSALEPLAQTHPGQTDRSDSSRSANAAPAPRL